MNVKYEHYKNKNVKSVAQRRKKIRLMTIAHAGGKCMHYGYDKYPEFLEFHHKDPSQKKFGIGQNGLTRSWARVKAEVEKCNLLCANCHREEHVEERLLRESKL